MCRHSRRTYVMLWLWRNHFYIGCYQPLSSRVKKYYHSGERSQHYRPDTNIPLSRDRLDMAVYTFSHHIENGCALEKDSFLGNKHVQELLLKFRFEENSAYHKASCFKKGCECWFLFRFMSTTSTYIHEDKGDKNEKEILWYSLDVSTREICPFLVLPKRPMGCQYINPQNSSILNVFNFNTNIQIGNVL